MPAGALKGRETALSYEEFYRREFPRMVTLAALVSNSSAMAEDVAQDALVKAEQNWDTVGQYEWPGAWLRRVTINLASKRLRRARAEAAALLRLGPPPPVIRSGPEELDRVMAAIRQLPKQQRAVVVLVYLEDRSVKDVAEILGCAEGTAKAHLFRARTRLATILSEEDSR